MTDAKEAPARRREAFGQGLLRGSLWMIAARWAMRLIGLASTLVLARLLSPDDFGLVAMAMMAYGLLETISWAGVDLALLRDGRQTREHYDTAWTIQILQGCFIAACLAASAPWVASYFDEPRLVALALWIAPRAIIDGLQNIGVVAFRQELDFAKEFRFNVYTKLVGAVLVIGTALWLRNYWALVVGSIASGVAAVVVSYLMHPYRPRLSLSKVREIWSFSQWLMVSRVGTYLNRKCDEFVVGGQVGTAAIGAYHVASDLGTLPSNELVMPIRRALFPSLATLLRQPAEFESAVLSSFAAIASMCLFAGAALAAVAPEFVGLVLGAKWGDAVPLLRWLAVFGAFSAIALVLEVPIWVVGRTHLSALQSWTELGLLAPLVWLAVTSHGAEGAAIARLAVSVVMLPVMMVLVARVGCVRFGALAGALWRPLVAAALGFAAAAALRLDGWPLLVMLPSKVAVVASVYTVVALALWTLAGRPKGVESELVERIRNIARRRGRA